MSESVSTKFSIRKYTAVIAILIVLVMTVLDVTVVNVALPVMASKFGISDSYAVWIVTIYQLVITMLLLPMSSFGDRYSYRRCFMVGVTIFTLASACVQHRPTSHSSSPPEPCRVSAQPA